MVQGDVMRPRRRDRRVLIYSHDSFGLGHLRRCREIAHALVEAEKHLSVLILSGSPIIGSFDFRARVDFVRVPGVIKLRNGDYTSLKLYIDVEQTLAMRMSIIEHTAKIYDPDLFIVDKEPLGLRGEVESTLKHMKSVGHALHSRPARRYGRARASGSGVGAQAGAAGPADLLRRYLGLRSAADLRSPGGRRLRRHRW